MVFVFIYIYCYPTRFPYQMIFVSLISNTNPSGTPEVTPYFLSEVPVAQSLIFYVIFCRQSSILFLLAIALSVFLWVAASDYPFCIFKLVFTILFKANTFSLLSISIFRPWAYMRKVIAVTSRVQYIIYLRFHSKLTQSGTIPPLRNIYI